MLRNEHFRSVKGGIRLNSLNDNKSTESILSFSGFISILNCIYARKPGALYPSWSFCIAFTECFGGGGELALHGIC